MIPELDKNIENNKIDEKEEILYTSLIKTEVKYKSNGCYIFLIDQNGSMQGTKIELCNKALLLFLQSLNIGNYFQLIGFGSTFEYYCKEL